ncbi:RNA polymerase sigma factor [Caldicoprobacter guelmensis]|uniref:RNA polymerase sigma-I factor n=1 Tax=Caldicoprobacter guelmensis TaxID=1170224 RepID=UPI001FAE9832|nr:RNA polymerase sigma-I factor [Caldicoprobacter guelmensis]MBM7581951.1 RNA polymerase sigma factor [Caldicoprobacter guelmensis]
MNKDPIDGSRNEFIEKNRGFIYKMACSVCKRKLDFDNDDELSIAMIAFNNACDSYDEKYGNFFSYAAVVIRNALIDYFRKSKNSPVAVFSDDDQLDYIDYRASMRDYELKLESEFRRQEIKELSEELNAYGIDFELLVSCSPKHKDTRDALLNIALYCVRDTELLDRIRSKKALPIKELMGKLGINRKMLERWRKYIIALVIILAGDYPYIKSYLNIKVGENE